MAQNGPGSKPLTSKTLHRTLQDLETALSEWDALSDAPAPEQTPGEPNAAPAKDDEIRERTKRLLAELRKQLGELSE